MEVVESLEGRGGEGTRREGKEMGWGRERCGKKLHIRYENRTGEKTTSFQPSMKTAGAFTRGQKIT